MKYIISMIIISYLLIISDISGLKHHLNQFQSPAVDTSEYATQNHRWHNELIDWLIDWFVGWLVLIYYFCLQPTCTFLWNKIVRLFTFAVPSYSSQISVSSMHDRKKSNIEIICIVLSRPVDICIKQTSNLTVKYEVVRRMRQSVPIRCSDWRVRYDAAGLKGYTEHGCRHILYSSCTRWYCL